NVFGIILEIGINKNESASGRVIDTSHDGSSLAGVAAKSYDLHFRVHGSNFAQLLVGSVSAPVVDGDDLEPVRELIEDGEQRFEQGWYIALLVVDGHYD